MRELKARDNLMIKRVETVDKAIKTLQGEEKRKVSVTELSVYLEMEEDEIGEVLMLMGETGEITPPNPSELFTVVDND